MYVSAYLKKTPDLRGAFRKRRLTNTPRCHCLADGQLSSIYAPYRVRARVWRRLYGDVLFRSSRLFERTLCDIRGSDWSYVLYPLLVEFVTPSIFPRLV